MTDPDRDERATARDRRPGDRLPGDRLPAGRLPGDLARAPGERYHASAAGAPQPPAGGPAPSTGRAVARGALAAAGGAVVFALLGGLLSMTAGLLAVAAAIGWLVGRTVGANADPAGPGGRRSIIAAVLAVDAIVLGLLGIWVIAALQGGRLGLVDYLAQTRGALAPLEIAVAAVVAWWSAR